MHINISNIKRMGFAKKHAKNTINKKNI